MKYIPVPDYIKRTNEDDKWLKNYFKSSMNLINTKSYVDAFLDYELEIEKEIKLINDYNKLVQEE